MMYDNLLCLVVYRCILLLSSLFSLIYTAKCATNSERERWKLALLVVQFFRKNKK